MCLQNENMRNSCRDSPLHGAVTLQTTHRHEAQEEMRSADACCGVGWVHVDFNLTCKDIMKVLVRHIP